MSKVFLRMEEASTDGMEEYCENNNGDKCYFGISGKECPRDSNENIICCGKVFIQDTIIPKQLALYDEFVASINNGILWSNLQSIIDRAKKIEEATQ